MLALIFSSVMVCLEVQQCLGYQQRSRNCTVKDMKKATLQEAKCFDQAFQLLYLQANRLLVKSNKPSTTSSSIVDRALRVSRRANLSAIQLKVLTDVVHYEVNGIQPLKSRRGNSTPVVEGTGVVQLASDVLDEKNMKNLQEMSKEFPIGERILQDFDSFAKRRMQKLDEGNPYISKAKNIELLAFHCENMTENIVYKPGMDDYSIGRRLSHVTHDSIILSPENFKIRNESRCTASTLYFKTLQQILPSRNSFTQQRNATNFTQLLDSRIISLSILTMSKESLIEPVKIQLHHISKDPLLVRKGVFWQDKDGFNGEWSDAGCDVIQTTFNSTTFQCNHLTNFAILVTGKINPDSYSPIEHHVLSTMSTIGCFMSMIGEVLTLAGYAVAKVQSKRRIILINVVLALLLAQAIFIAGIENARHHKFLCAFVASLISYFFLASFFWMLNMAIQLTILTSNSFNKCMLFRHQLVVGFMTPLVIISFSLIITQGKGFGTSNFCWLSSENGTVWILIGPVASIIMANITMTCIVVVRMFRTKLMQNASKLNKIMRLFRAIFVLTPSLGFTWVFGIFAVAEENFTMQIVFAFLNSFQGVFIFFVCCMLDKKVRSQLSGLIRHPSRLSLRDPLRRIVPKQDIKTRHSKYGPK